MKLGTQAEARVVDDRMRLLYVAEKDVGLWRFAADTAVPTSSTPIAQVNRKTLMADTEGLALAPACRPGGYLVVSSQGDDAYTLYRLPGVIDVGCFCIREGVLTASDTDGIELALGDFGFAYS
jgi:3-phytase